MDPEVQENTRRLYKWGIFSSIVVIIITVCVCLPFIIWNESKRFLLIGLIIAIVLIIILTLGVMEWFRRKSQTKKRNTVEDPWVSQTLHTRRSYSAPTESSEAPMSGRSSWIHWIPKKKSRQTTPEIVE